MARFYAVFNRFFTVPDFQTQEFSRAFQRKVIGEDIFEGQKLQDGLIASRSALSNAFYPTLDAVNRDGTKGTLIPLDKLTTDLSTFVSGPVYTSSVDGIKIPVTNTYGIEDPINYSKRPTSSVFSTQTALVGPSNPSDTASVSYALYKSASDAVVTVLNSIQGGGPYSRLGNVPSRTIHSIWNDPGLNYFGWDDFTPGTGSLLTPSLSPQVGNLNYTFVTSSTVVTVNVNWESEYTSDKLGTAILNLKLQTPGGSTIVSTIDEVFAGAGYTWTISNPNVFNSMTSSLSNPFGQTVSLAESWVRFSDVTIPASVGGLKEPQTFSNIGTINRMVTLTQRVSASVGNNVTCYPVNIPIYAGWDANGIGPFPNDPNPVGGGNTQFFRVLFSSLNDGNGQPVPFAPYGVIPAYNGGNYWLIQTFTGTAAGNENICEYTEAGVLVGCSIGPGDSTCTNQPACPGDCALGTCETSGNNCICTGPSNASCEYVTNPT